MGPAAWADGTLLHAYGRGEANAAMGPKGEKCNGYQPCIEALIPCDSSKYTQAWRDVCARSQSYAARVSPRMDIDAGYKKGQSDGRENWVRAHLAEYCK